MVYLLKNISLMRATCKSGGEKGKKMENFFKKFIENFLNEILVSNQGLTIESITSLHFRFFVKAKEKKVY